MKIGLVVEQFDPLRGGLEQWSFQFASQLLDRGHEVHVVARRFGDQVQAMPIVAHRLDGVGSRIGFAEAAERKLRGLALDVTHDTGAGWYCDVFQPHGGSRRVVIEHNLLLLPPWLRPIKHAVNQCLPRYRQFQSLMERQYVDDGRILLALSRQTMEDFQRIHGTAREQIRLIYNGVDPVRFSPQHRAEYRAAVRRRLGIDEGTLLLLIVAHNFPLKGVPTLLHAVSRLIGQRSRVHLAVVGGKRPQRYEQLARRLGATSAVTFTGTVRDTVPFYAAADVYVHPTFHDSCSLVVLEALASGLPVVTSRLNGAAELMTEAIEGFVMEDPGDVDELLSWLEPLFDPAVRRRMGQAARSLALDHSLERNVNEVLAVYDEVIENRLARRRDAKLKRRKPFVVRKTGGATVGLPNRVLGTAGQASSGTQPSGRTPQQKSADVSPDYLRAEA